MRNLIFLHYDGDLNENDSYTFIYLNILVPIFGHHFKGIRRCRLVEGGMSLEMNFEDSKGSCNSQYSFYLPHGGGSICKLSAVPSFHYHAL